MNNENLAASNSEDGHYGKLIIQFHRPMVYASQAVFRFFGNSQSSPSPCGRTRAMSLTAELAISLAAKLLAISTRRPVHASCAVFQTLTFLFMFLCVHIFDEGNF